MNDLEKQNYMLLKKLITINTLVLDEWKEWNTNSDQFDIKKAKDFIMRLSVIIFPDTLDQHPELKRKGEEEIKSRQKIKPPTEEL